MQIRSLDPLEKLLSLTQQIVELRQQQHEALKSAIFFGMTREEASSIGTRRTELNDLIEQLAGLACVRRSNP